MDRNEELLTIEEVARILKKSSRSVARLVQSGEIPSLKVGGSRRVSRKGLQAYLDVSTTEA